MTGPLSNVHRLDLNGADRLTTILMEAFEVGDSVDPLNPQRAQLQSLGPSLENLSQELRREMTALSTTTDVPQPGHNMLRQTLERLSAQVAKLIDAARADAT